MEESSLKLRGEHSINVFVSYELKVRIKNLADRYDRTMADMVRCLVKVGIPVLEGLMEAEEKMLSGYLEVIRKARKVSELKENR